MHENIPAARLSTLEKLKRLRESLAALGLAGFLVPHGDEHQSEYPPPSSERLAWLTGFEGSAGSAAVLADKAAVFVDGRYTLQVRDQVDGRLFSHESSAETPLADWLAANVREGDRVGYDPWLHTKTWVESTGRAIAAKGAKLVAVQENPVDAVWADRPAPSTERLVPHGDEFAGRTSADKRAEIASWLKDRGADAVVIMTEWNEFRGLDLKRLRGTMSSPVIVDARNVLDPAQTRDAGFTYVGTGRAVPAPTEVVA